MSSIRNEDNCTSDMQSLFHTLAKAYEQTDDKFFLSDYDVLGYRLGLLPEPQDRQSRIYNTYNFGSSEDSGVVDYYASQGVFKCYNCDLCNINDSQGILQVKNIATQTTNVKSNIAAKQCVYIDDTPTPMILSGSDDQYLRGQALLTTLNHVPNHWTFMDKDVLKSIFSVISRLTKNYPNTTAYWNGRFGSSLQHSHVHLSPDCSPIATECKRLINQQVIDKLTVQKVVYKSFTNAMCVATQDLNLTDMMEFTRAYILKHVLLQPENSTRGFVAHIFRTTDKDNKPVFGICFLTCNDVYKRMCDNLNIFFITAISTVSLLAHQNRFNSPDFSNKEFLKCLQDYSDSQYLTYNLSLPSDLDFTTLGTEVKNAYEELKDKTVWDRLSVSVKGRNKLITNFNWFSYAFYYLSKPEDKYEFCYLLADRLKPYLLEPNLSSQTVYIINFVYSYISFAINNISFGLTPKQKKDTENCLREFKIYSVSVWLKTFLDKVSSLRSGICYSLRGYYVSSRLIDLIEALYLKFKDDSAKPINVSKRIRGTSVFADTVDFTTNLLEKIDVAKRIFHPDSNLSLVVKLQKLNTNVKTLIFEHELKVGLALNKYRNIVPNIMMTYGGWQTSSGEGFILLEDLSGDDKDPLIKPISLFKWIKSAYFNWVDFLAITGSLMTSIFMLKTENGFSHWDLHLDNIMLVHVGNCGTTVPMKITYEYGQNKYKEFVCKYIPVMIDYGSLYIDETASDPKIIATNFPNTKSWFVEPFIYLQHCFYVLQNLKTDAAISYKSNYLSTNPDQIQAKEKWFSIFGTFYKTIFKGFNGWNIGVDLSRSDVWKYFDEAIKKDENIYPSEFQWIYNLSQVWWILDESKYKHYYDFWFSDLTNNPTLFNDILAQFPTVYYYDRDDVKFPENTEPQEIYDKKVPEKTSIDFLSGLDLNRLV